VPPRLHLGAFDQAHAGWLNTDISLHLLVARVPGLPLALRRAGVIGDERWPAYQSGAFRTLRWLDVSRPFRFPDGAFEAVFAAHLLEHLHADVAMRCLQECQRVLRPGGVIRLAVPDLDKMVADYDAADPDRFLDGIYQGRGEHAKRSARHFWHYNERSLAELLRAVGFLEPRRCEFRQGRLPDVEQIDTRPGSLFMEATR
jgi:SAM-dependent methyltransferase